MADKEVSEIKGKDKELEERAKEIEEGVINILAEQFSIDKEKITRETRFVKDLGADSLHMNEFVMMYDEKFEERFGELPDDDKLYKMETVGEFCGYAAQISMQKHE